VSELTCSVVWAKQGEQYVWRVRLPPGATLQDALIQAARSAPHFAWRDAAANSPSVVNLLDPAAVCGVFGRTRPRHHALQSGDRVEVYGALRQDPKTARRARARQQSVASRAAAASRRPATTRDPKS
jgi:uncharacterized protein